MNSLDSQIMISQMFTELISIFDILDDKIGQKKNPIINTFLENNSYENIKNICKNLKINVKMIQRNKIKISIVGKTSNGKSAVINALLNQSVLPSNKSRTTSCCIVIEGCDEDSTYIIDKDNKKKNISLLKDLANETSSISHDIDSFIRVFVPRNCRILKNDLELIDSPGLGVSPLNDSRISEYCDDSDIIILVVDGNSTLNESERSFFYNVINSIGKPNVFYLINRWDLVTNDPDSQINKIKMQHLKEALKFLEKDLKLYSFKSVHERIYFISALNELLNKDSYEFKKFENDLYNDIQNDRLNIKFQSHIVKGIEITNLIFRFLSEFLLFQQKNKEFESDELKQNLFLNTTNLVHKVFGDITQECKIIINMESPRLAEQIFNIVEKKSFSIDKGMIIMEESICNKICDIYTIRLNYLDEELNKMFMTNSCYKFRKEQINCCFDSSLEFRKNILSNFTGIGIEFKKILQENKESDIIIKLRELLKKAPPVLMATGSTISKTHPNAGLYLNTVGAVVIGLNTIFQKEESYNPLNNLNKEIADYFTLVLETILEQMDQKVNKKIKDFIEIYTSEQHNMNDLFSSFEELKNRIESISSKLTNIKL